jgi:beta-glucosidase/6-phospho-beta-glucosidase/beta-galactosidase
MPDGIDVWSPAFIDRFASFAGAAARVVQEETGAIPFFCPINEISFWAWAGGEVAQINPWIRHRGRELKRQLARASIAAIEAIRAVDPSARFLCAEPAIHVGTQSLRQKDRAAAEFYRLTQYEACDLISGRLEPEIGGQPHYLDVMGVNYYPQNQWINGRGGTIPFGHHSYRPFHEMLKEVYERYGKPLLVSETGAEGSARPSWLHYVCAEVREALAQSVPILGICLYPILDYPGWDNDRCCKVGLLSMPDANGDRSICGPLFDELKRQQIMMEPLLIRAPGKIKKTDGGIGKTYGSS